MSKSKDFGTINEGLLTHCQPYVFEPPWQGFPVPSDVRLAPADPSAMINDLRQEFPDAQLQEAGVIVQGETGAAQPNPILCGGKTVIIGCRETRKDRPFELVTDQGCLPVATTAALH
jgi:hypothetical protein